MDNLRDHFAGLAMQAIMQSEHHLDAASAIIKVTKEEIEMQDAIAMLAYTQAEAMIQVRNRLNAEPKAETAPIIESPEEESSKKHLKSLEEHNNRARKGTMMSYGNEPVPNGIACPKCGEELMDSNPMMTLTSFPAQKNIHCPKCEYRGFRIA